MKAELKAIYSLEVPDLINYKPEYYDNFSVLIRIIVGPKSDIGEESFDIEVCTPLWIISNYKIDDIIIGRHHLIVMEYNYERLFNFIKKYVDNCSGDTWNDIANKIDNIGRWEFEGYNN